MPTSENSKRKPSRDVELTDQYRAIGSAAILAALACKMRAAEKDAGEAAPKSRAQRAA